MLQRTTMAYTTERLERALRLFPQLPQQQKEERDLAEFTGPTYELRNRKRKGRQNEISSWIDNDDDEDYDPHQRRARCKRRLISDRSIQPIPRPRNEERSQSRGSTIPLDEDSQEANLISRSAVEDSDEGGMDPWEKYWAIDPELGGSSSRYQLRARKKSITTLTRPPSPAPEGEIHATTQVGKQEDASSTPKGCLACQELEMSCTLVDWPLYYPCSNCRMDNIDCQLVPSPKWKRPCEKCRVTRGQRCSYRFGDYDHSLPCQSCLQRGFKCVAGPARHEPPTGLAVITDVVSLEEPQYQQTNQSPSSDGLARDTDLSNIEQLNEDPKDYMHTRQGEPTASVSGPPRFDSLPDSFTTSGNTFRVWTDYPHPLEILPFPIQDLSHPCHWCSNFAYGIVGFGARMPEVVVDSEGRLIELQDGHTGEGKEPSRMCQVCLFQRLSIINCSHEDIRPLPQCSLLGGDFDKDAAFNDLAQAINALADPESQLAGIPFPTPKNLWCSLCREPAFFACQTDPMVPDALEDAPNIHLDPGCEEAVGTTPTTFFLPSPSQLSRAATRRAQLTVTTSSTKRRKVSPEPHSSPGEARRHGRSQPPPTPPLPPRSASSASNPRSKSASLSPPRYVPAHLQAHVPGTRSQSGGRSPTPATATAHLTLSSEHSDMQNDPKDGASPTDGAARSPSPGEKRPASEIAADTDPEGGVDMAVDGETDAPQSIDEQVAQVNELMTRPLKDGQKGFVLSMTWLKKVLARSTTHAAQADKESLESELGPVDNSDIVLDIGPDSNNLKDEMGEPYVPMRPGLQLGEDYEIVPQEGWNLITKWYGLADQSPVIVRYAHDANPYSEKPNVLYELNPPVFTIFKLSNLSAGMSPQLLREKNLPPARALSGRQTNFQKWLKEAKQLAGIDMATKVRVWKIMGGIPSANPSASTTPAVSRTASPAPAAGLISSSHKNLLVDLNTFLSLNEGTQRELLHGVQDQTNNPKYNGRMSVTMAGLVGTDVVVLEEQVGGSGGSGWASEESAQTLKRLGIPIERTKKELASATKSPTASGRSSPALDLPQSRKPSGHRLGLTGLNNLGNTCYQNAATQCVRAVEELSVYFLENAHKKDLNFDNPLGYRGELAKSYSGLLHGIYRDPPPSCFNPSRFRNQVGRNNPIMAGWEQHDSQEFLMFLLDGLSEDLNRILKKPYIEKPDSTDEMVHNRHALEEFAAKSWEIYKARNDSVITDLFAGMYKSTLVCPSCEKVSIMFDPFSSLTLPIPSQRNIIYREVIYMSLHSRPQRFMVEVDKSGTVKDFIQSVATKRQVEPQQLVGSEVSNGGFWQLFDDDSLLFPDLRIKSQDTVTFMELDAPADDRILVPVFHRKTLGAKANKNRPKRENFALPYMLSLTRQESQDLGAIYRKLLRHAATMTTRDILNEQPTEADQPEQATEDSDTVVMNEDDANSGDSRIKTSSVEGDDSIVDISMRDVSQASSDEDTEATEEGPAHPLAGSIPSYLLGLFDVRVFKTHERIPRGRMMDPFKDHPLLASRVKVEKESQNTSPHSSGDKSEDYSDTDGSDDEPNEDPLIRSGEAILIDWHDEARHALFGGRRNSDQGAPTFDNIEFVPDPELVRRRAERDAKRDEGIDLDECLQEFSKEEILSQNDAWYCPRCKEHRQASKKFELWSSPDILVVHLKRFTQSFRFRSKLDTLVRFPLHDLDLTKYVSGPNDGKSLVYDLIGVDCHSGSMGGGHYYAFAKNFITGDWCDFNDTHAAVVKNPERRVVTPAAYLLFYRRQSSEPLGGPAIQKLVESYRSGSADMDVEESQQPPPPSNEGHALSALKEPSWSFDRPTATQDADDAGDADLFEDNDSNVAVEDGNSEPENRLHDLDTSGVPSEHEGSFEDVPPLLEDASDDELPVVELRVGEDERMNSDA
ncbi:uncharacterized protein N7459_005381 [Penicillium hispanicum]|uniref:uncharacterized protein n=1 Tax=Penicillium hispanicum TaxID=1080232 RepID=UPI002541E47D|nr:uncharacterized protein N7459_005381 [Penicillium hispanicum]KAJ5585581.1 hypothetical protein N7459_005381 [Penicillium hispanicum]